MTAPPEPSRLARSLGTADAVVVGLGAMLGAGVFVAVGPAAAASGSALLLALALAAAVAYGNATSSAQLAALYPQAGGAYVYGRRRLGPTWGWLAGWCFVVGKLASCTAMALTVGAYLAPGAPRPAATAAVLVLLAANLGGIRRTARLTRIMITLVLLALAVMVAGALTVPDLDLARLWARDISPRGVLQAAGLLFFAFAGYARIATLGEEISEPRRTIPRAIPLALGIVLVVYLLVDAAALAAVGPDVLAASSAPLVSVTEAGRLTAAVPIVRAGAALASISVLLSLLAGVGRTVFAMAANADLPRWLDAVHARSKVPHRAESAAAGAIIAAVWFTDLRGAIGFSALGVLLYYGIANLSAWTLPAHERRWPRWLAAAGAAGCVLLAFSLPVAAVVSGVGVVLAGLGVRLLQSRST
ncbi:MAG: APC family permease [Egibacteraceae bacterium]